MGLRTSDILVCGECKKPTVRRSPAQRYCTKCSSARDVERKAKWALDHGKKVFTEQEKEVRRDRVRAKQSDLTALGAESSRENASGASWYWGNEPLPCHSVQVAVPFDRRFSKNALWSSNSAGHVYMRQEIKDVRDDLVSRFIGTGPWYEGKVWISIFVEKPDAKSDAINVVDGVCDAVKKGIGVDDRWFSIRRLDWAIVKIDPKIRVTVAQEVEEHHRCCSYCGRVLPLEGNFGRNRSMALGYSRECLDCRAAARRRK